MLYVITIWGLNELISNFQKTQPYFSFLLHNSTLLEALCDVAESALFFSMCCFFAWKFTTEIDIMKICWKAWRWVKKKKVKLCLCWWCFLQSSLHLSLYLVVFSLTLEKIKLQFCTRFLVIFLWKRKAQNSFELFTTLFHLFFSSCCVVMHI